VTTLQPWWERFPGLLDSELCELERLTGEPPVVDADLRESHQIIRVAVRYVDAKQRIWSLLVTFSDLHPFFAPVVMSKEPLSAHQEPTAGVVCLLPPVPGMWNVEQSVASFLAEQLPKVLDDHDAVTADADAQLSFAAADHVEPMSEYYRYTEKNAGLVVDGQWDLAAEGGTFAVSLFEASEEAFRGLVRTVESASGAMIAEVDPQLMTVEFGPRVPGTWARCDSPPDASSFDATVGTFEVLIEDIRTFTIGDGIYSLSAVVFPDEVRPGETADTWLFLLRQHKLIAATRRTTPPRASKASPKQTHVVAHHLIRAHCGDAGEMFVRVPGLEPLRDRHVVQVGCGGVGAPSAVEFAKAGTKKLTLLDNDHATPGNAVRWPLGMQDAGSPKVLAVGRHIMRNWPYTEVALSGLGVGGARMPEHGNPIAPQWVELADLCEGADLLYDAAVNPDVSYFLSELARERGVPLVVVSATEGGWGGRIALLEPAAGICWSCLMHHVEDEPALIPPTDPDPATNSAHPAGCLTHTFSGTGFDVASVALAGVRLAVATLCRGRAAGYPSARWNVAVYDYRSAFDVAGGAMTTHSLNRHPECGACHRRCG
jgi:molybdopterin/thiamine biosynthesis adenylyltransferase